MSRGKGSGNARTTHPSYEISNTRESDLRVTVLQRGLSENCTRHPLHTVCLLLQVFFIVLSYYSDSVTCVSRHVLLFVDSHFSYVLFVFLLYCSPLYLVLWFSSLIYLHFLIFIYPSVSILSLFSFHSPTLSQLYLSVHLVVFFRGHSNANAAQERSRLVSLYKNLSR